MIFEVGYIENSSLGGIYLHNPWSMDYKSTKNFVQLYSTPNYSLTMDTSSRVEIKLNFDTVTGELLMLGHLKSPTKKEKELARLIDNMSVKKPPVNIKIKITETEKTEPVYKMK